MVKTLLKSVRQYKKASILAPVCIILEVILECIIPLIMSDLLDSMNGQEMSVVFKFGFILIFMALFSLLFGVLSGKFAATASCGLARNLRHDQFASLQRFSFSNIDKFSPSGMVTRLTTDITNVQMAYMMTIRIAVRAPLMFLFSLIMAFTINARMALIFVIIAPFLIFALFLIFRKVVPIFNRLFKKYDAMNESVQENIKAVRVVKSYVREDHEIKKFGKTSDDLRDDFTRAEKIAALVDPVMRFFIYIGMLLVSFLGALMIIKTFGGYDAAGEPIWGELSVGELSSLITYAMQVLSSLMMLAMVVVMLTMAMASGRRIAEVLNETPDIRDPKDPVMTVADGSVDFNHVSFAYAREAERPALSDIDLHIKSGQTVGILGEPGSGKSSLVQLIPRLYDVTEGSVLVGGVDVRNYDLEVLRNEVSFVLQKNLLFSGTILDNMRWGNPDATEEEVQNACKLAMADEFIQTFPDKYHARIEQGGTNVSGGQKQRLCIARALLKNPKVLVLDDSTSAVDTKTDAQIRATFREKIPNVTKIIISQRVASVQDADQIVVLSGGAISGVGTHEQLMESNQIYREIYDIQSRMGGDADEN